jgi:dTDP-4-amino-4,6-dideoxygalactose transaminase
MGAWGQIASFSFFPNKNMTTAEGGMLVTDDGLLAQKMRTLRSHGMTTLTWDRHRGHAWSYDVVELGYNYRIDEIRSAIGCEQLKKLERNNARRAEVAALYRGLFQQRLPDLGIPFADFPWQSSFHIMPILLPEGTNRIKFAEIMKAHQVQTSLHYPPIHLFQYYREHGLAPRQPLRITEAVAAREVTIPMYATMTRSDVEYVVNAVHESLKETRPALQTSS